jgi:DNA-binding transcriptional LysR family regulator
VADRIEEWRVFGAVASHKSFVAAARTLGRSPQHVTRAIAALEERLGARLFHRTTRAVSLTSEGARLLEQSRRVLEELDHLEAPRDPKAKLSGRLSVTAPVLFGQMHVVPVVSELLAKHPALDVRLVLLDRVVSLADEGIDVAVRIGPLPDSSLRARLVGHVRSVIVASPAYLKARPRLRTPRDLGDDAHSCIAFAATTPTSDRWTFPADGRPVHVNVRARLVVNDGQAAMNAALAGLGVVRLLSYQVARHVENDRLRIVLGEHEPPLPIHLLHLPGIQPRAAPAFLDLAADKLRGLMSPGAHVTR